MKASRWRSPSPASRSASPRPRRSPASSPCSPRLALAAGLARGIIDAATETRLVEALTHLPGLMAEMLKDEHQARASGARSRQGADVLYLGRGTSFPIALEGALKLKELSYIHAEAYAAGELKHGPIALIDEQMPVIVIAPHDELFDKTASNVQEVAARGGRIILITDAEGARHIGVETEATIILPKCEPLFAPILYALAGAASRLSHGRLHGQRRRPAAQSGEVGHRGVKSSGCWGRRTRMEPDAREAPLLPQLIVPEKPATAGARLRNYFLTGIIVAGPRRRHGLYRLVDHHDGRWLGEALGAGRLSSGQLSALSRAGLRARGGDHRPDPSRLPDGQPRRALAPAFRRDRARPDAAGARRSTGPSSRFSRRSSRNRARAFARSASWNIRRRACGRSSSSRPSRAGHRRPRLPGKPHISVFLPCTPNPTTGFYFYLPRERGDRAADPRRRRREAHHVGGPHPAGRPAPQACGGSSRRGERDFREERGLRGPRPHFRSLPRRRQSRLRGELDGRLRGHERGW